jgi:hypothetical protein
MKRAGKISCASGLLLAAICLAPRTAHAQYKNSQFGLGGGVLVLAPGNNINYFNEAKEVDPWDGTTAPYTSLQDGPCKGGRWPCGFPYRTLNPVINFWFSTKLSDDSHWWFTGGLNLALISIIQDPSNGVNGGTTVFIEPMGGPRYYFLTDNIRPFVELGIRVGFIAGTPTQIPTKLAVLPGIYGQLGFEFMVARDISLVFSGRDTFLVMIDFHQENMFEGLGGIAFYF